MFIRHIKMERNYVEIKNRATIYLIGVVIFVLVYTVFFGALKKYSDSLYAPRSFSVSAEGKTTVTPDIAKISFGVVTEGSNPKSLAEENNKKMKTAIDMLKSKGIEEKDVKTTQYDLSPRYEYIESSKKTIISGYTLTQTVLVKIRDLNKVADILGTLPDLGINKISSVSFEVDEPEKYLKEARDKAFETARLKARDMAKKNGVALGKILNIYEYQNGGTPRPYYYETKAMGAADVSASIPTIQPGSQEITIQATITYSIK